MRRDRRWYSENSTSGHLRQAAAAGAPAAEVARLPVAPGVRGFRPRRRGARSRGSAPRAVVERRELADVDARARARSASRRTRRSSAAAARAGRCRSCWRCARPRCRCAVVAVSVQHAPERPLPGPEAGAPAVVLEAGEHARRWPAWPGAETSIATLPISRGRPRARCARRAADTPSISSAPSSRSGRAAGSRRRRPARARRGRRPRAARRACSRAGPARTGAGRGPGPRRCRTGRALAVELLAEAAGGRSKPIPRQPQRRWSISRLPRSA